MDLQRLLLIVHLFGFAVGVGGATVVDIFFFKFLRDYRISKNEADFMRTLSRIMWGGVILLALSGIGLFLLDPTRLLASAKFVSKMVVVAVLVANGAFLHFFISPKLRRIAYMPDDHPKTNEFRSFRQRAFVAGGVSIVSWYYAFLLAVSRFPDVPVSGYMSLYAILLVMAFGGAFVGDWIIRRKAERTKSGPR